MGQDNATSVEIKIISVHVVGAGKRTPGTADEHNTTHRGSKTPRESWSKKRSKSRPRRHASRDSEDGSTTHEAHSIESNVLSRPC